MRILSANIQHSGISARLYRTLNIGDLYEELEINKYNKEN